MEKLNNSMCCEDLFLLGVEDDIRHAFKRSVKNIKNSCSSCSISQILLKERDLEYVRV